MEREILAAATPTSQVKLLASEKLSDGQVHTRKELVEYIVRQGRMFGFPPYRDGHISGGIRQAVQIMKCESPSTGKYRATVRPAEGQQLSKFQRASRICLSAREQLTDLAQDINFVTAGEGEMAFLLKLKECVQTLHSYQEMFQKLDT